MTGGNTSPHSGQSIDLSNDVSLGNNYERSPLLQPQTAPPNTIFSVRYILAYMAFFGFATAFMSRVTLSVAITAMVNSTYSTVDNNINSTTETCEAPSSNGTSETKDGEFSWDANTQELILASFFYGYIILQIPAGFFADKHSKASIWMYGLGYFACAICTLLTPIAARSGVTALLITRFMGGLIEGWTFPALYAILSRWAPPSERSRLVTIAFSGIPLGEVIGQPIAGLLASSDILGGWPAAFYLSGSIGVIWFICWIAIAYDSPASHPRISAEERDYILTSLGTKRTKPRVYPWKSLLTSLPVMAVGVADFAVLWILYILLTNLPIYLNEALKFDIIETGFIAAIPYLFFWITIILGGVFADFLIKRRMFSLTGIRKLFATLGFLPSALFMVLIGYVGCNATLAVIFVTLGLSFTGLVYAGPSVSQLDFAPKYAGIITALVNTVATTSGFVSPAVVGIYTEDQGDIGGWRIIFWICFGICIFGWVFFMIFGTAEPQSWAVDDVEDQE